MPTVKARQRNRKPFQIFEAGMGEQPIGLVQRAARFEGLKRRKRFYVGVDIRTVNLNRLLKAAKLKRLPKNAMLIRTDIFNAMRHLKPNSRDLIFESYLLNMLMINRPEQEQIQVVKQFLEFGKRALRPGGRMVLVQSPSETADIALVAKSLGFSVFSKPVKEENAKKSPAKAIQMRSTPELRERKLEMELKDNPNGILHIMDAMDAGLIEKPDDYAKPILTILQKPAKEGRIIQLTTKGVLAGLHDLSPTEQKAAYAILGK